MDRAGSASLLMRIVYPSWQIQSYVNCQGTISASMTQYAVPEYGPERCQWGPRPVLGEDLKLTLIFYKDPIRYRKTSAAGPVVNGAYCDAISTAPVSIYHAALAAFIDNPDLFHHRDTGFMGACHSLSPIIVVKYSKYLSPTIIGET